MGRGAAIFYWSRLGTTASWLTFAQLARVEYARKNLEPGFRV